MATTDRDDEIMHFDVTEDGWKCDNCGSLDVTQGIIPATGDVWLECETCWAFTVWTARARRG